MKNNNKLRIHSIETFGTQDGPGIRMIVFVQGCEFRCLYCHNPDTFETKAGRLIEIEEIVKRAKNQEIYFGEKGGVTISGGEPLIQSKVVTEIFKRLKKENINTCLDTNGRILNESTKKLLDVSDLVMVDVKHINDSIHKKLTGMSNQTTLKFAEYREKSGKPMWLRYVLVPNWTDQEKYLEEWAEHFKNYKTIERVEILPYHQLGIPKWKELNLEYKLGETPTPSEEIKQKAKTIFEKYIGNVILK